MEDSNYFIIARLQRQNWWYRARRHLLDDILAVRGPFEAGLDLGCGVGANFSVLDRHCRTWTGVDPSAEAVRWCNAQGYPQVIRGDATGLLAEDDAYDLVTCLDVLEHLDDVSAICEIQRVLRPGGHLVVTVPAHPYLWNENDEFSQHQRRYRRQDLCALLEGFVEIDVSYWNFTTYLPMLAYAAVGRVIPSQPRNNLDAVPGLANGPLTWALLLENRLRRWLPTPIGTSLVATARVPGDGS